MEWLLIGLVSIFFFSCGNLFDKYLLEKHVKGAGAFMILATGVSFTIIVLLTAVYGFTLLPFSQIIPLLISGILVIFAYLLYAMALEKEDTSTVIPLFQMIPVFILVLASIFLGEKLSLLEIIAFFIILIGALVIVIEKKLKINKVFCYMVFSSLFLAISPTVFKYFSIQVGFIQTLIYELAGQIMGALLLLSFKKYRKELKDTLHSIKPKAFLFIGITDLCDILGQSTWKFAITLGPAALITVFIGSVQPFIILILGILLTLFFPKIIKENISKKRLIQKIIGICIITLGTYFLYLI